MNSNTNMTESSSDRTRDSFASSSGSENEFRHRCTTTSDSPATSTSVKSTYFPVSQDSEVVTSEVEIKSKTSDYTSDDTPTQGTTSDAVSDYLSSATRTRTMSRTRTPSTEDEKIDDYPLTFNNMIWMALIWPLTIYFLFHFLRVMMAEDLTNTQKLLLNGEKIVFWMISFIISRWISRSIGAQYLLLLVGGVAYLNYLLPPGLGRSFIPENESFYTPT